MCASLWLRARRVRDHAHSSLRALYIVARFPACFSFFLISLIARLCQFWLLRLSSRLLRLCASTRLCSLLVSSLLSAFSSLLCSRFCSALLCSPSRLVSSPLCSDLCLVSVSLSSRPTPTSHTVHTCTEIALKLCCRDYSIVEVRIAKVRCTRISA